jgi:outer membrane protein OmpA-like peptidoglycan-associated protein
MTALRSGLSLILVRSAPRRIGFACFVIVLASMWAGCGKKPRPLPPVSSPPPGTVGRPATDPVTAGLAPELDLLIEPEVIGPGESALLSWSTRHAEQVSIEPAIGLVDLSGRIKVFPDATTTWTVSVDGPGGNTVQSVTVEVRSPGRSSEEPLRVGEEDLSRAPLEEQFPEFMKPVFFGFDSSDLDDQARLTLDGNARWLLRPENLSVRVIIEGHADTRGTEEYNLALGDKRSIAVRDYLVSRGVDTSRLIPLSLGEERPIEPGETEEAFALNRRAHFVLPAVRP